MDQQVIHSSVTGALALLVALYVLLALWLMLCTPQRARAGP